MKFRSDAAVQNLVRQGHLDAGEGIVFARELETIEATVYDVKYPELRGRSMLPKFGGLKTADEVWTWRQLDKVRGMAVEASMDTDDIPNVEIQMAESRTGLVDIMQGYGYTVGEIRAAQQIGRPLDAWRALAAREAVERKIDKMIAVGSVNAADNGMYGLLNQPLSTAGGFLDAYSTTASGALQLPVGTGGGSAPSSWGPGGCKPREVVAQLNAVRNGVIKKTNGVHSPNTLVLDLTSKLYIETTPCSDADTFFAGSVETIEQYIRKNAPWLQSIEYWLECNTAGPSGKARSVLYEKNMETGVYGMAQEFEQFPVQMRNLKFWIPCHAKTGGVKLRFPKAFAYIDGLQP